MFDIILAITKEGGIGLNGRMAWRCKEELQLFKEKTDGSVIIVGRKTAQSLPKLNNRVLVCVSRNEKLSTNSYKNRVKVFKTVADALIFAGTFDSKIFVAGCVQLYE